MPDIFSGTWDNSLANVIPSGVSQFVVKLTGDDAYYDLGATRDNDIQIPALGKEDTLLRFLSWGFAPAIKVMSIQCALAEIEALAQLVKPTKQPVAWSLKEMDGKFLKDDGTKSAIHWKLHAGPGKFDDFRKVEYNIIGNRARSESDSLYSASAPTLGTPNVLDALYALAQAQVAANNQANGLSKVEFKASTDASYAVFGDFEDAQVLFETNYVLGGGGRQLPRCLGIRLTLEVMGLESSMTQKQLQDAISGNFIDVKLTFMDGLVCTIPNTNIGASPLYKNVGNVDKARGINLKAAGACVNWNGTDFFATDGTTKWSDMWA